MHYCTYAIKLTKLLELFYKIMKLFILLTGYVRKEDSQVTNVV